MEKSDKSNKRRFESLIKTRKKTKLETHPAVKKLKEEYDVDVFHLSDNQVDKFDLLIEVLTNKKLECVIPCDKNFIMSKFTVIATKLKSRFKQVEKNGISVYDRLRLTGGETPLKTLLKSPSRTHLPLRFMMRPPTR